MLPKILIFVLVLLLAGLGAAFHSWMSLDPGTSPPTALMAMVAAILGGLIGIGAALRLITNLRRQLEFIRKSVWSAPKEDEASGRPSSTLSEIHALARTIDQARNRWTFRCESADRVRRDLQSMLETIPEAVVAIDEDQRVLFANPNTYRLFDLPDNDVTGQKLWAILRQPALARAVDEALASRAPTSAEFEIRHPSRIVSFRARGLTLESGRGLIIVLHDATEIRRLERLRQEFFASVSHELKTPLAAIKAYTETLLEDASSDPELCQRFLSRIDEQADRLHSLVIDMLMLARVESEDHLFDIRPMDAIRIVLTAAEAFRPEAQAKNIHLDFHMASDAAWVMADAEGLGMIINNLVDNAIKYTPDGGAVTVGAEIRGLVLEVEVADTGVGIPPQDLARVFERFYRVDKARSREMGGTGLGLSIVKHLTQRFGGTVAVRSRLHSGSTFTVSLPLCHRTARESDGVLPREEMTA